MTHPEVPAPTTHRIAIDRGGAVRTPSQIVESKSSNHRARKLATRRSLRSRVTRRPKVSLHDTGVAARLAGFTEATASSIGGREYYGALVEQFVALNLANNRAGVRIPTPCSTFVTSTAWRSISSLS